MSESNVCVMLNVMVRLEIAPLTMAMLSVEMAVPRSGMVCELFEIKVEFPYIANRFTTVSSICPRNGVPNDTFQDYNIHEPGVISETTVDGKGPFYRPENDYFFTAFEPPQNVGTPQNFSSRNTNISARNGMLCPASSITDSPTLFARSYCRPIHHYCKLVSVASISALSKRTAVAPPRQHCRVKSHRSCRRRYQLQSAIALAHSQVMAKVRFTVKSRSSPTLKLSDGSLQIDRLGTDNVVPLTVNGQINPDLAANHIQVIKDSHGKTSSLSAADLDALIAYIKSLDRPAK